MLEEGELAPLSPLEIIGVLLTTAVILPERRVVSDHALRNAVTSAMHIPSEESVSLIVTLLTPAPSPAPASACAPGLAPVRAPAYAPALASASVPGLAPAHPTAVGRPSTSPNGAGHGARRPASDSRRPGHPREPS